MPSPGEYEPDHTASSKQRKPPVPKLGKSKRVNFLDKVQKAKNFVPAPGKYDTLNCLNFTTKGASRGYK